MHSRSLVSVPRIDRASHYLLNEVADQLPRRYKNCSLASVASIAKSVLNRPDLSSNQVHGLVNRSIGYLIQFFLSLVLHPVPPLVHEFEDRKSKLARSEVATGREGILEEKSRVASIRLKNVVACSLCRLSICCFARERFQNPSTYTREIFGERYACRRKDCIMRKIYYRTASNLSVRFQNFC